MDIAKAKALPVGTKRHGRIKISANPSIWKPIRETQFITEKRNHLSKFTSKAKIDLESLPIISLKDFCKQVDLLYVGGAENDKKIKNVIRLPDLNIFLTRQLGIGTARCFFTKTQMTHCRPTRKETYNQALRIEEFKRIPKVIENSKILYYDKVNKNFFIPFRDRENPEKVNKISFYEDEAGNYAVTVGKIKILDLNMREYIKIGAGNNPQIHKSSQKVGVAPTIQRKPNRTDPPNTRLLASSDSNFSKSQKVGVAPTIQRYPYESKNKAPITRFSESSDSDKILTQSEIKSIYDKLSDICRKVERMKAESAEYNKKIYNLTLLIKNITARVIRIRNNGR